MKRLLYALEAGVSDCCERFGNFWETTDRIEQKIDSTNISAKAAVSSQPGLA